MASAGTVTTRRFASVVAPILVLGLAVLACWAPASPAGAQAPADPNAHAVQVAIALTQANAQLGEIDHTAADVAVLLATANAALATADQQLTAAQTELQTALDRLRGRAAKSYQLGGSVMDPVLDIDHMEALNRVTKYANAAADIGNDEVTNLRAEVLRLTGVRDAAAAAQQGLAARAAELAAQRAALAERAYGLAGTLAQLGGVPISGESALTAEQIAAFFTSKGGHANLPEGTTIADLAQAYVEEGGAEHVRADVAFAQSMVETGGFTQTRGNNYAGIGNCDSCGGQGIVFPTPRDGVRAQIQLLRNYADPDSRAANLANPPEPTLYGADPGSAAASYDSFFLKGKVPLWNDMGNGNWATSTTYAASVLGMYAQMLEFAASH
jgi:hypothetical protein